MLASVAQPQTCESAAAPIPFTRTGQAEHTNLAHHTEHAASKARLILCALSEEHLKCLRTTAPESVIEVTLSTSTAMGIFQRNNIAQAASTSKSKKKKKNADSVNTLPAWIRKGCCFVFCITQWMQRHTTSYLENKVRGDFQWESGGCEVEACSPPGVLWGLFLKSRLICMNSVADLIACRLNFAMSAMACRPVTPRLWSGFLVWLL